jgi:hypothetical protein
LLHSTFKRKPRKRVVSRSFRLSPKEDDALGKEARRKGCSKSHLIRDILKSWLVFHQAKKIHSGGEE